jgi:predicted nucleic acid-binding protein
MASFYFDSSALVKYYIIESGTEWVRILVDDRRGEEWANTISTSALTWAEVISAFAKRHRMGGVSTHLCRALTARFLREARLRYGRLKINDAVIEAAVELIQRHPLRAYDAVQLASALILNDALIADKLPSLTFVSADNVLCEAAQAEGLPTENPNEYE